ncbi:hypothetical protein ACIQM4_27785 [Streptomyces sp. NPDC091272]|uniref:hypothetical protein n=1 Tax=Streptomyces sp. NPDC091272 TaxID=3365981 RepID=UPI003805B5EC
MTTTAPATAAESLAGLARVRPAGWLANPMPRDQDAVLARAREVLERDHPGIDGRLTLLAARYTAAVVAVHTPAGTAALKLHADPAAYAGESLAYTLLDQTAPVALLHDESPRSLSMVIEYLPKPFAPRPAFPEVLVDRVAAVHTASLRLAPDAATAMAPFRLGEAAGPLWIVDRSAWADVICAHREAYGPNLVPFGHLDLKPEHLRVRADGTAVLLDVETLRPDVTGLIDLVTLPAVLRQAGHEIAPTRVAAMYRSATAVYGGGWSAAGLRTALRAFAAATGLESLHGLI